MTFIEQQLGLEYISRQLIGLTILKVEYSEINYQPTNPKPYYSTQFINLDSVDYSIFLHTDKNKLVETYWDDKFFQFGIGIKINQPSDFSGEIKWDVSNNEIWKHFVGLTISDIDISWETVTTTEVNSSKTGSFVYPQDIKITFSNTKSIFISAAGFLNPEDKKVHSMRDNLMVTDNEELARQVKMIY